MMEMNVTEKEREMLQRILNSEYHDKPLGPVWLSCVAKTKADGGVVTSLQSKGLVTLVYAGRIDPDNTVELTQQGLDAVSTQ